MTVGQVPIAAFAEALGADAAAVESLADGAQLAATNANLGAASEQGAEGGLAATVGQAGDEAQDAEAPLNLMAKPRRTPPMPQGIRPPAIVPAP